MKVRRRRKLEKRKSEGQRVIWCASLIVLLTCFCTATFGQQGTSVSGNTRDENGGKISGVIVTLASRDGVIRTTTTDSTGNYTFLNVVPGEYILRGTAEGFASYVSEPFELVSASITKDFALSVGGIAENVVVIGSGTPQNIDEVAKSVTVIGRAEIETRNKVSLSETLRGTPGLRVQQQGSYGSLVSLRFRGLRNFDTSVLFDGLRVRDASDINGSSAPLFADLVPSDLDRIEVLRGSGSSLYGTNAIGGVINLVPQDGAGVARFQTSFEGGNLGFFRGRVGGSGGLGGRAGYSFNLTRIDVRRGIDGNDQYGNTAGTGRLVFNPTSRISIAGNFHGSFANARVNDSPFALNAAFGGVQYPPAIDGVTFFADTNNPDQGRRNNLLVGSARLVHSLTDDVSYTVAYQHVSSRRRNYNGPDFDPGFAANYPFGDFAFNSTNNGSTDTLDLRVNVAAGRWNLFTGGFEFEAESLFQKSEPSFTTFNGLTDRQRTYAVFGQDQISLLKDRLQVSLGFRAQSFRIRAADRPGQLATMDADSSLTGDASFAWFLASSRTKLRGHVGNGFRAPALFERFGEGLFGTAGIVRFGDPTLKAEQSLSFDGGIDQQLAGDKLRLSATYFYTKLQRTITFTSFTVDPLGLGRFSGYVNRPGGLARGAETSVEASPFKGMSLFASYTYTNSDRTVPGGGMLREYVIPRHLVGVSATQRILSSVLIGLDLYRTGSYIAPVFENSFPFRSADLLFPGYTKVDIRGSYELSLNDRTRMTLFGTVENLFDVKYFENGFRAPGITGRAGIGLNF